MTHGRNAEGSESQVAPGLLPDEERSGPSVSPHGWRWYCRWCGEEVDGYPDEPSRDLAATQHVTDAHPGPYRPWFASFDRLLHVWPVPTSLGNQPPPRGPDGLFGL